MSETNVTLSDPTHRIFISSAKTNVDRTGLYIIILLIILFFILVFYLLYNLISYKRYCSSLKTNKNNMTLNVERQLSERLSSILMHSIEHDDNHTRSPTHSYEHLIFSENQNSSQMSNSLLVKNNVGYVKKYQLEQYRIQNTLISEL